MCEEFAQMLYTPGVDRPAADEPSKAFDSCGFRKWTSETQYVDSRFSSTSTTTQSDFMNSIGVKSFPMNELGSNFKVQVISKTEAEKNGHSCLSYDASKDHAFSLTATAAVALASLLFH